MINPGAIPQVPGDLDALAAHAATLRSTGAAFADTGARVHATFQGLAVHYEAPEVGQLLAATQPVAAVSADVGDDVTGIGSAGTYAETVRPIKARLEALRAQAHGLVTEAQADKTGEGAWERVGEFVGIGGDDDEYAERSNELIGQVNAAVAEWKAAERACANAILALYSDRRWRADDGDGRREPGEYGYTAAQLNQALGSEQGLPWGRAETDDGGFLGGLWSGVKGVFVDGLWGDVVGLGSLVGLSGSGWSWQTMKNSWGGVANLTVFGYVDEVVGGELSPWEATTTVWGNWGEVGKGVVAFDQWDDNPARAGGQLFYNVVTLPLAVTKGAKAAGAAGHAADAGRAAGAVGDAGRVSRIARGIADGVNRMPTVDEIARNAARKFNIPLPQFGPTPAIAGDAPVGGHRFDVETPGPRGPDTAHMDATPGRGADDVGGTPAGHHAADSPSESTREDSPDDSRATPGTDQKSHSTDAPRLREHQPDPVAPPADTPYAGDLVEVSKPDPHADRLAERLDGQSRVRFGGDPAAREFDVVSDEYVGQAKPSTVQVNKTFRLQAKATFEAAQDTGRSVYYHFDGGPPSEVVVQRLQEYARRYDVRLVLDSSPL